MIGDKDYMVVGKEDVARLFPKLPKRSNKGGMGRVLCICGCADESGISMCGAAYFTAMAAYRCGAGIVEIFTDCKNYAPLASLVPESVFSLYDSGENGQSVCERLIGEIKKADAIVIGCGIGKSEMSAKLVRTTLQNAESPMLIDADALNILSDNERMWQDLSQHQRRRTVITPHPGEMSRIIGKSVEEILKDTVKTANTVSKKLGVVCLLKDHHTVISNGEKVYVNHSGNAGMATAGMGDVLAGVIGALLCRTPSPLCQDDILYRVAIGAYLHGVAGDAAARKTGEYSLMSSDVLTSLPKAISMLTE
ncbi:MAG: NAD(P)H-hydrate dehydratase [Ruminococcaceae bacterium]|nr:NAD(P)H-hydrate dehydratase [Oscillospiraceae bacterium]